MAATTAANKPVNKNIQMPQAWADALQAEADRRGWSLTRLLLQGAGHFLPAPLIDALPSLEERRRGRPATKVVPTLDSPLRPRKV